jgi:hypothetical protein
MPNISPDKGDNCWILGCQVCVLYQLAALNANWYEYTLTTVLIDKHGFIAIEKDR